MLRAPCSASSRRRRSISSTAFFRALVALRGSVMTGVKQMRNAFVHAEFHALRIDQDHADIVGRGFIENRHHERVDHDALAGTGGAGDQQVRHGFERGHFDAAVDILAERDRQDAKVELVNSSDSRICRSAITSRLLFGTSMPTVGLPGMRSMRMDSACRPRQRSSRSA